MRELGAIALSFFMMVLLPFVVVAMILLFCFIVGKLLDMFEQPAENTSEDSNEDYSYYYEAFDASTPKELQRRLDDFKAKAHKDRSKFYSYRTTETKKNG